MVNDNSFLKFVSMLRDPRRVKMMEVIIRKGYASHSSWARESGLDKADFDYHRIKLASCEPPMIFGKDKIYYPTKEGIAAYNAIIVDGKKAYASYIKSLKVTPP